MLSSDSGFVMPFRSLQLAPQIHKAIEEAGYAEPTPIQLAAVPEVLAGRDVIGIAQTGTGKTAAFVWPILTKLAGASADRKRRGMRVLIVAPTRELVVQIEENVSRGRFLAGFFCVDELRHQSDAANSIGLWHDRN